MKFSHYVKLASRIENFDDVDQVIRRGEHWHLAINILFARDLKDEVEKYFESVYNVKFKDHAEHGSTFRTVLIKYMGQQTELMSVRAKDNQHMIVAVPRDN